MTEQSQVHVIRLEADSFVWCFRCDSRIEGIGIGVDNPDDGIDLHPGCARALGQELLDATKGEPTP